MLFSRTTDPSGQWVEMDPELQCQDRTLLEIHTYWKGKCSDGMLPRRADVDPLDLRRHLANLILIDVEHDPLRLRYRLIGTRITEAMQRNSTGRYYDEIYDPEIVEDIYASFRWIFANRRPLRTFGQAFYPDRNFYSYETLNLPLSTDGTVIDMVLGGLVFHMSRPPADANTD